MLVYYDTIWKQIRKRVTKVLIPLCKGKKKPSFFGIFGKFGVAAEYVSTSPRGGAPRSGRHGNTDLFLLLTLRFKDAK